MVLTELSMHGDTMEIMIAQLLHPRRKLPNIYIHHQFAGDGVDEVPAAPLQPSRLASIGEHAFIFWRAASNCSWLKSNDVLTILSGSPPRLSGVSPLP